MNRTKPYPKNCAPANVLSNPEKSRVWKLKQGWIDADAPGNVYETREAAREARKQRV